MANLHYWGFHNNQDCSSGKTHTMSCIVGDCQLNKFSGELQELHMATKDAITWLSDYAHADSLLLKAFRW